MSIIKIVKKEFVENLIESTENFETFSEYLKDDFQFPSEVLIDTPFGDIEIIIKISDDKGTYEFENAVSIHKALQMNRTAATDIRLWTYLTHVTYWDYMKTRRNIQDYFKKVDEESISKDEALVRKRDYIFEHYLIRNTSIQNFCRSEISGLWWGAELTNDNDSNDDQEKYLMTKEYFSMLDYTRHLTGGQMGRCKNIVHSVLTFVIENPAMFEKFKEDKVRYIMRFINRLGGIKPLSALNKQFITEKLKSLEPILSNFKPD